MNRYERRRYAALLKAKRGPGGVAVLDRREVPEGTCDLCQAERKELRPYGPAGEWICFDCAMQDEAGTARRYREYVFGDATH